MTYTYACSLVPRPALCVTPTLIIANSSGLGYSFCAESMITNRLRLYCTVFSTSCWLMKGFMWHFPTVVLSSVCHLLFPPPSLHHVLLTIIMTAIMANVGVHMGLSHNVYIQCDISLASLHVYRTLEWCCQSLMLCAWNVRHLLFLDGQFYHLEEIHEKGQCV